jgi:glutamate-1-semialdehyde 2,1-aminomutase
MLARGIYPPPSQFEAWFLSGAHTTRHIDQAIEAARATLHTMRRNSASRKTSKKTGVSPA